MQHLTQDANSAVRMSKKIYASPVFQYFWQRVQQWNGPPFLLGPAATDLPKHLKDFKDRHNQIRNLLQGSVIVIVTILAIYYSQTDGQVRDFIGWLTGIKLSSDTSPATEGAIAYASYMVATNIAAIFTQTVMDAAFFGMYGEHEFVLALDKAQSLALAYNKPVDEIVYEFNTKVAQLNKGLFAPGARRDELIAELKAVDKGAELAKRMWDEHAAAFNAHLDHMAHVDPEKHAKMQPYRRQLHNGTQQLFQFGQHVSGHHHMDGSGPEQPFLLNPGAGAHSSYPTYGTVPGASPALAAS